MSSTINLEDFLEERGLRKYYERFLVLQLSTVELACNLNDDELDLIFQKEDPIVDKVMFRVAMKAIKKETVKYTKNFKVQQ